MRAIRSLALAHPSEAGSPRSPARRGDAARDERRQDRRGARDGHDRAATLRPGATSSPPGSLTSGVPASVTSATSSPAASRASSSSRRAVAALGVVAGERRLDAVARPEPARQAGVLGRDHATARSTSRARSVMSPRLPMGVATTYSVPSPLPCSGTVGRQARRGAGPAARIEVVDARRPGTELGDRRHLALELGARHHPVDPFHHRALEAHLARARRSTAADPPAERGCGRRSA